MLTAIPCIICGVDLESAFHDPSGEGLIVQPYKATTFDSSGQYGSTSFDPMDGSFIVINVCDECLLSAAANNRVVIGRSARQVRILNCVVGWEKVDHAPYIYWRGQHTYNEDSRIVEPTREAIMALEEDEDVSLNIPAESQVQYLEENGKLQ